ncbi:type III-A CRISPR-associated RAMP protein Csm5 [Desulfovibrio sp. ZJ200]|uniref:type III-A CRISPR-associated RAMP protein Csm5 n=1 Tax=Desulfovibrio sp. ZJ200 TaxID=2709792 RepID=UPI0013EC26F2|nr:type III-A CRISPR-associated RAMP protein Csm5 [Desulfovibrio sp. ZJ200]
MPDRSQRSGPRRWTRESFLPFRLEALTPVFIGSGSDLSPLEYVIRQEGDVYALHLVDAAAWLQAAQDKADIRKALDSGEMLNLRRLMDEHLDAALYSLARVAVSSAALAENLRAHIKNPGSLSKAEVQPLPRSPVTMAPYIPGSSLKGALSTALIDRLDHGGLRAAGRDAYADEMKRLLGSIRDHSMQALKVSDIPIPPGATRIVAAAEARLNPEKPGTPKTPCEVLPPAASGGLPLYGRLLMDAAGIGLPGGKVLSFADLGTICKNFYEKRFREELGKFYQLPHLAEVGRRLKPVLSRMEKLDPQRELLLRVGHYSHVECVTVSENAPQARKGAGKTRTLADRELPFGWVVLCRCEEAEYKDGVARVEGAIKNARREREQVRAVREEEIRRAVEEQRKRAQAVAEARAKAAEEQRRKEREAAEREAALAALSPEERAIAEVAAPDAPEERSMELFARLDSLEGDLRVKAAAALRDCWQRLGKWQGKLSQKQQKKVAKVKQLLGE